MRRRLLLWKGLDEWRTEATHLEIGADGLRATGTQIGVDPLPYAARYALVVGPDLLTRSLEVEAIGDGWSRRLALSRQPADDSWGCASSADGDVALDPPGCDAMTLRGATDCDLGRSPLTNLMPVRRAGLHERRGTLDVTAAWVAVPVLTVHRSEQRYEHRSRNPAGATVRYVDRGVHEGFSADLTVDADGVVLLYPGLARAVEGAGRAGS